MFNIPSVGWDGLLVFHLTRSLKYKQKHMIFLVSKSKQVLLPKSMSHYLLQWHQIFLSLTHPQRTSNITVNIMWGTEEATSLLDRRKCDRALDLSPLAQEKHHILKKRVKKSKLVILKGPEQTADSVACWFQGTQPISQHCNQAKSLPVGLVQEGHNDSHTTAMPRGESLTL